MDLNEIKKYFPSIITSNSITIKDLLNHRSRIHNFTNDKEYLEYNIEPKNEKEILSIISKADSD